jgi:hypothetical protein
VSLPVFIDAAYAADMLHMTQEAAVDLIASRNLRTYGGAPSNPFVRSADISALVTELGPVVEAEGTRRGKSAQVRVQTRLTADSKWAELSDRDIAEWAERSDRPRRLAARKAAEVAKDRLDKLLEKLNEVDASN